VKLTDCFGMFSELEPSIAAKLLPGLPAYIMIMCIRYTDHINDDNLVRSLLTSFINTIKKLIKKRKEDIEIPILWLANVLRYFDAFCERNQGAFIKDVRKMRVILEPPSLVSSTSLLHKCQKSVPPPPSDVVFLKTDCI